MAATPAPSAVPLAAAAPTPVASLPPPTPHPDNSPWVKERLDAVIALYNITDAGADLLHSLDVRQMRGEPGFFGSYGFKGWAGVGEARPIGVMHELSHSYWGGFPVEGLTELGWDMNSGDELSPAMQRYHSDVLAFMSQPPDDYEVFRQRLRHLPGLSEENLEPLFHNAEADLIYNIGGNLALVPPVLRKYWSRFIHPGPFASWHNAVGWYQSLSSEDRTAANKYLGFEHLDLRQHRLSAPSNLGADLLSNRREILAQEERQRLYDLADQFDLLLGDPRNEENFEFWRGYLSDKLELHRRHPGYLESLNLPRAAQLAAALEFFAGLPGLSPAEQAQRLAHQLPEQPFLVSFLPVLDNRALLELFASGMPLPEGATLRATASFVQRLNRFGGVVDQVLDKGRESPELGAAELEGFLDQTGFGPEDDLKLFFELFRDADSAAAREVTLALDKETIRQLMEIAPFQLRTLLPPEDLLGQLNITAEADDAHLKQGITLLVRESSGNFIVDEPYLSRMYQVMARRSMTDARGALSVIQGTPFPLEGFIQQEPSAAVSVLNSDLEASARLIRDSDPVLFPPARVIYRLIYADPALAARLTIALEGLGATDLVIESLAHFAYDKSRSERVSGLPISLERDGKFLESLPEQQGAEWLAQRLEETFTEFDGRASRGDISSDFLSQYYSTLKASAATLSKDAARKELQEIIDKVAAGFGFGG